MNHFLFRFRYRTSCFTHEIAVIARNEIEAKRKAKEKGTNFGVYGVSIVDVKPLGEMME